MQLISRISFLALQLLAALPSGLAAAPAAITLSSDSLHDPVLTKYGDNTYCAFGTGSAQTADNPGGIRVLTYSGTELSASASFSLAGTIAVPSWTTAAAPGMSSVWAPEIHIDKPTGTYYLYYAVSIFGTQTSAIGVASSKTPCDPSSWVDQGQILSSSSSTPYNAIDPNVFKDDEGTLWMQFGSFYGGIYMVQMASPTAVISSSANFILLATRPTKAIEGASMLHYRGYFYHFASWDKCCSATSNYKTKVGRSTNVEGPYLDSNGTALTAGGGTHFLIETNNMVGPGGGDIFVEKKSDGTSVAWFAFHYYDSTQNGLPLGAIQQITWSDSQWPLSSLNG